MLYKTRVYILLFFLVAAVSLMVGAQNKPYLVENSLQINNRFTIQNWNTENGLPQNSILSIAQTPDGRIWLITYSGLVCYDGQRFTTFDGNNTKAFEKVSLTSVFTDLNGELWVTAENKLFLRQKNDVFKPVLINNKLPATTATAFEKNLYLGTTTGAVYYQSPGADKQLLVNVNNRITGLLCTSYQLYIATAKGIYKWQNKKLLTIPGTENLYIRQVTTDEKEKLWFIDSANRVFCFDDKTEALAEKALSPKKLQVNQLYADNTTHQIWLATNLGLYYFSATNNAFKKIDNINTEVCQSVLKDQEGNLLVGSNNEGLNILKPKLFHTYTAKDGLKPDGVAPVIALERNKYLIGDNGCGGVYILEDNKIKPVDWKGFPKMCTWSLLKDHTGRILAGGSFSSFWSYANGRSTPITSLARLQKESSIYCLFEDARNRIFVGTDVNLYLLTGNNTLEETGKGIFRGKKINHIIEDSQKRVWVACSEGIYCEQNNAWLHYTKNEGLSVNNIRYLYEDSNKSIWIGSVGGGLMRYAAGKFFNFGDLQGMANKNVWCIVEDNKGYLWMSSNNGIYAVKKEDLDNYAEGKSLFTVVRHFDKTDGMNGTEFNGGFQAACLKTANGELFFPGQKGLTVIDPQQVDFSIVSPQVKISAVKADGQEYVCSASAINLPSNSRVIEFDYAASVIARNNDVYFQTFLEGQDKDWSLPTQAQTISFKNIKAGTYTFKVRVYGSYDKLLNKETSVVIAIPPPLWFNPFFVITAAVIVLLLITLFVILRTKRIRRQAAHKSMLDKQYAALELKALQSQMNPHFIFNCLNAIKYFISVHDETSASKYLQAFSRLLRKFLEHSDSNFISLAEEIELLSLYVELQQLRFEQKFNFTVIIPEDLNTNNIHIPTMLFQPYVENAIIHGLLPLTSAGNLSLGFETHNNELVAIIKDDGLGRNNASGNRKGKPENRSMGMSITAQRIDLLNYFNQFNIRTEVSDSFDSTAVNCGTTVKITIPIQTIHHDQSNNN